MGKETVMKWLEENYGTVALAIIALGGIIGVIIANFMKDGNWVIGLVLGVFLALILMFVAVMLTADIGRLFEKKVEE